MSMKKKTFIMVKSKSNSKGKTIKSTSSKRGKSNVSLGNQKSKSSSSRGKPSLGSSKLTSSQGKKSLSRILKVKSSLNSKSKSTISLGKGKQPVSLGKVSKSNVAPRLKSKSNVSQGKSVLDNKPKSRVSLKKSKVSLCKRKSNILLDNQKSSTSQSKTNKKNEKSSKAVPSPPSTPTFTVNSPKSNLKVTPKKVYYKVPSKKMQKALPIRSVSKESIVKSKPKLKSTVSFENSPIVKAIVAAAADAVFPNEPVKETTKMQHIKTQEKIVKPHKAKGDKHEQENESPKKPRTGKGTPANDIKRCGSKNSIKANVVAHGKLEVKAAKPVTETAKEESFKTAKCQVSEKVRGEAIVSGRVPTSSWSTWLIIVSVIVAIIAITVGIFTSGHAANVGQNIASTAKSAFSKVVKICNTFAQAKQHQQ